MSIELKNNIEVEEYNNLREQVGWNKTDEKRIEKAIKESAFLKKAVIDNQTVGMSDATEAMRAGASDISSPTIYLHHTP